MNLPLLTWDIPFLLLRLVTCIDRDRVCGLTSSRLEELVDEGVNVRQERRGSGSLRSLLGGGRWSVLWSWRNRGQKIQVGGAHVIPVDDDQEDHEGRAQDEEGAEHPGCSHGDCCLLWGPHGNRVKVAELLLSTAINRGQLQEGLLYERVYHAVGAQQECKRASMD